MGELADDRLRETVTATRVVHRGAYIEVRVDDILTPDGRHSTRDIVGHPGAVAIVALDPEERVLLVRQLDRKSTRLNSSHIQKSRMPSSA